MSEKRFGLFELSGESPAKNVNVVAVHGLMGDPFETWGHGDGVMWLKDFLVQDLPSARIMTVRYDSAVAFSKSVGNIEDNALTLLNQLGAERPASGSEGQDRRPILFICHSLGGIIVKKGHGSGSRAQLRARLKGYIGQHEGHGFPKCTPQRF